MSQPIETLYFPSAALGREQPIAILPPDVLTDDGRCFTLFLLHGMHGSYESWPSNTDIADRLSGLPILAVMPSAENSYYMDSEVALAETFLCKELIPYLDSAYPTVDSPGARAVTGFSMGGYGALLLALRNGDLFGSAASLSGAVLTSRATREVGIKWDLADQLYGVGPEGEARRREHDLLTLAQRHQSVDSETGKMRYSGPALYLDCGTEDFLFYASREFTQALRMLRIPHEYHEQPGDHDWDYWKARLPFSLAFHLRCWGI